MAIFNGIRGIVSLMIHIANRNETGYFNLFLNIVYIPIGIILIAMAAVSNPVIIPVLIVIQLVISRKVDKMMRDRAGDRSDEVLREAAAPEVENQAVLQFDIADATSASIQAFTGFREATIERVEAHLRKNLAKDIWVAFGYFGAGFTWWLLNGDQHTGFSDAAGNIGLAVLVSVVLRWLFMGKLYRPVDEQRKKFLLQSPIKIYGQELASFLHRGGTNLAVALLLASSIFNSIAARDLLSAFGLVVFAAIHYFLLTSRKPKTEFNIKLLLLRTFDIQSNTVFTFGRLLNYWEHIGNYFTVVDISYIKHKYRLLSRRTLGVIFLIFLLAWLIDLGMGSQSQPFTKYPWISFPSALLVALVVFAFENYQVKRGFIKSREMIGERITAMEQRPRGLADGTFMGIATMCHANTWRGTVAEMMDRTTIVMMDLRGFARGKDGCKWELDFLFDKFPVDSFLILIDARDDVEFIKTTITDLWKTLRLGSPNLNIPNPTIHMYKASKQDETDVQGIFDHLLGLAFSSGRAQGVLGS